MMWKFLRKGATVIPGAASIPESRIMTLSVPIFRAGIMIGDMGNINIIVSFSLN